jgi:hypothetical protein
MWYTLGVEQSDRRGAGDDAAEGLAQAATLTVGHLSGRTALNLTAHMTLSTLEWATNVYYEQMATHGGNWAKLFLNNKGVAAHSTDVCAQYPPSDPGVWDG